MKRITISTDSLNSYGFRVMTAGINTEQYEKNPVMLYMHERGNIIGYFKELKVENGALTGEPVFDEATEQSKASKKQYECGSLKMASVGIDVLETSSAASVLLLGQKYATVTRSNLYEISLVDVGSNNDCVQLRRDGETIRLSAGGKCNLPIINNNVKKEREMETKIIAVQLGLPETATDEQITAELARVKASDGKVAALEKEKVEMALAAITSIVDTAVTEKRIGAERKEQFLSLGKTIGAVELKKTFEAMTPQVKLSEIVGHHGGPATGGGKEYVKLSEVPEGEIETLRANDPATYKKLYKAEYGIDCEI